MTKFNISNFKKSKTIESNDFTHPQWVTGSSSKVKDAYQVTLKMFDDLKSKIESGESVGIKERKLVPAQIAKEIDVDRSYLTPRRTQKLCSFIDELNQELNSLWKKQNPKKAQKPQSKTDLQKEITKYKKLYTEERDRNYSDAISELLASEFYGPNKRLRKKYHDLQVENVELNDKVSSLTSRLRSYTIKGVK